MLNMFRPLMLNYQDDARPHKYKVLLTYPDHGHRGNPPLQRKFPQ